MFKKILIANRGEIACRVIKTARKMGVRTVAVYSDADRDALHVAMADEAVHIGAPPPRESYLCIDKVIAAARQTGAEAIHPGYGFLSENAEFCRACEQQGIVFIGPPVAAIEAMGSKSAAKTIMESAGVPLVPGYHGDKQDAAFLKSVAEDMGYPVLLKAAAGGGGKGMRQVWSGEEFDAALDAAKREARNAFNDDIMLIEKYLTQPRHVEIQVFCDSHGGGVYLAERDCSVQRRHQKVIEEAPAPGMSDELRQKMGDAALDSARAIDYVGAGTVEFLLDSDGSFYFMEMNTRLQVEHPVTEFVTGQDLVEWQLRVAAGEPLPLQQSEIRIQGHAVEVRIYAEDPDKDFLPATGTLTFLQTPEENDKVRIDTGVRQGDVVSVYYDPMIAKLIVWDDDRNKALLRMARALTEFHINGVTTNIDFLYNLVSCQPFLDADLDTGFIEKHEQAIFLDSEQDLKKQVPLAALYLLLRQQREAQESNNARDPHSPWNQASAFRMNQRNVHQLELECHGQRFPVRIEDRNVAGTHRYLICFDDQELSAQGSLVENTLYIDIDGYRAQAAVAEHDGVCSMYMQSAVFQFSRVLPDLGDHAANADGGSLSAPMNGTIVSLLAAVGDSVEKGDALLVMEAMKMEQTILAPSAGVVREFYFGPGDLVEGGAELLVLEAGA